jgi:hypothetical protein
LHITTLQGVANKGAAYPFAGDNERWHAGHLKSKPPSGLLEHSKVAYSVFAELEVISHDQVSYPKPIHQDSGDEALRCHVGQGLIKTQAEQAIYRKLLEGLQFFAKSC